MDHRMEREGRFELMAEAGRPLQKKMTDYVKMLYITTSGYFNTPALIYTMDTMPLDRLMFSVDYPYESYVEANEWWKTLDFPQETMEAIAYKNAEALLKIKL
jgi:2,3-dihydroxybenzoate decarboxylase